MLDTIMMMLRDVIDVDVTVIDVIDVIDTCTHAALLKILFKRDWWYWYFLFQIYCSTSVPKIIKIELSLTKLLQK